MSFISKNEIEQFDYQDCIANSVKIESSNMLLELEALIVKPGNSQNTNYTNSYADDTLVRLSDVKLIAIIKEGYKYYDANDKLIEDVPDMKMEMESFDISDTFTKTFLIGFNKTGDCQYSLEFELPDLDPTARTDVYEVILTASEIVFEWKHYLNRVQ